MLSIGHRSGLIDVILTPVVFAGIILQVFGSGLVALELGEDVSGKSEDFFDNAMMGALIEDRCATLKRGVFYESAIKEPATGDHNLTCANPRNQFYVAFNYTGESDPYIYRIKPGQNPPAVIQIYQGDYGSVAPFDQAYPILVRNVSSGERVGSIEVRPYE